MKVPYLTLKQFLLSEFATEKLGHLAKEFYERHLVRFAQLVNDLPCSHRKHFVKIVEELLRSVPNQTLKITFDERADKAAFEELELKPTSEQNANFDQYCYEMKRAVKSVLSNLTKAEKFESVVFTALSSLIEIFQDTIVDPERFHEQKVLWLLQFNQANENMPACKPAGGWQGGVPS